MHHIAVKKGISDDLPEPVFKDEAVRNQPEPAQEVRAEELVAGVLKDECSETEDQERLDGFRESNRHRSSFYTPVFPGNVIFLRFSGRLHQLDEHASGRTGVNEIDTHRMRAARWHVINQPIPPSPELRAKRIQLSFFHGKGQMMDSRSAFLDELGYRSGGIRHLQKLKMTPALRHIQLRQGKKMCDNALRRHRLRARHFHPQNRKKLFELKDVIDSDPDVIELHHEWEITEPEGFRYG
ncbi:MAG: hypothetical protein NDJ89_07205 [Oligoflexia bacterium]|nr:hypothetical protein [Oligoflexia bacterium]